MNIIPKGEARAVADLSRGVIVASVEIAAPPERVFAAISTAEVAKWWGSEDTYRVTEWTGDLRPGGRWKSSGVSGDGKPFAVGGEFLEVEAPRLLVHTWTPDWVSGPTTVVRYEITAVSGGSRLLLRHEGFGNQDDSCESHSLGWERVLNWLKRYVQH